MLSLLSLQSDILKLIATGRDLAVVADALCRRAETLAEGVVCSILTIDAEEFLRPLAAPSLPQDYSDALDGFAIGPNVGSCGTAAYLGHEIVVTDIANDPLWDCARDLILPLGLKACWSSPIHGDDGKVLGTFAFYYRSCRGPNETERRIVETCVDLCSIAIRHHESQAHITRLAYTDLLTGLPNRACFERSMTQILSEGAVSLGVHYIDLDDFKTINDTLGHKFGDLLLVEVGKRLARATGPDVFVARLGGDEFAICCKGSAERQEDIARAVLASLEHPVSLGEYDLRVSASIGIALCPDNGRNLEHLTRNADLALYKAKAVSGNAYRFFSYNFAVEKLEHGAMKADLMAAIANDEFHLVYQPILDLQTGMVQSFEALLRWTHPEKGEMQPDRFIPFAEETGLIGEVGAWVLRHAMPEAASWPQGIGLSVNVSPLQLEDSGFALRIANNLARSALAAARLDIEITETALFNRGQATRQTLEGLRALGIGIALDDFGTGYSSLSLIRDRRFTRLKIDKSFVDGLGVDPDCEMIVKSTIDVARGMGFRTTAEGIETHAQLDWLKAHGCHEGQGFLLSRPVRGEDLAAFFAEGAFSRARL